MQQQQQHQFGWRPAAADPTITKQSSNNSSSSASSDFITDQKDARAPPPKLPPLGRGNSYGNSSGLGSSSNSNSHNGSNGIGISNASGSSSSGSMVGTGPGGASAGRRLPYPGATSPYASSNSAITNNNGNSMHASHPNGNGVGGSGYSAGGGMPGNNGSSSNNGFYSSSIPTPPLWSGVATPSLGYVPSSMDSHGPSGGISASAGGLSPIDATRINYRGAGGSGGGTGGSYGFGPGGPQGSSYPSAPTPPHLIGTNGAHDPSNPLRSPYSGSLLSRPLADLVGRPPSGSNMSGGSDGAKGKRKRASKGGQGASARADDGSGGSDEDEDELDAAGNTSAQGGAGGAAGGARSAKKKPSSNALGGSKGGAGSSSAAAKKRTMSCENCRRRKLKCDRKAPCGACIDREEAHLCTWEDGVQPVTSGRDVLDTAGLSSRLSRVENLLASIAEKLGANGDDEASASGSNRNEGGGAGGVGQEGAATALAELRYAGSSVGRSATAGEEGSNARAGTAAAAANASAPTAFTLSLGWQDAEDAAREAVLWKVLDILPGTQEVRKLCETYFRNMGWYHHVIDPDLFWTRLKLHEENRLMWKGRSRLQWGSALRAELTFVALILVMIASALVSAQDPEDIASVSAQHESPIAVYLDSVMRALDAVDSNGSPTLDTVRVGLIFTQLISAGRGQTIGDVVSACVVQSALACKLDLEPPADLPRVQMLDRVRVWACVCTMEWFGSLQNRRQCMISHGGPQSSPSFLYGNGSWEMAALDGPWPIEVKLRWELGRIVSKATKRDGMAEEEAYQLTLQLQSELDAVARVVPPELSLPEGRITSPMPADPGDMRLWRQVFMFCLRQLLCLHLHRRYYVQGWLDSRYSRSKELCLKSAKTFIDLFLLHCSHHLWMERLEDAKVADAQDLVKEHSKRTFAAQSNGLANVSLSASLLLQHHITMVDMYPNYASPTDLAQRPALGGDLRRVKKLLDLFSGALKVNKDELATFNPPSDTASASQSTTPASTTQASPAGGNSFSGGRAAGSPSTAHRDRRPQPSRPRGRSDFVTTGSFEEDVAQIVGQPWFQGMDSLVGSLGLVANSMDGLPSADSAAAFTSVPMTNMDNFGMFNQGGM